MYLSLPVSLDERMQYNTDVRYTNMQKFKGKRSVLSDSPPCERRSFRNSLTKGFSGRAGENLYVCYVEYNTNLSFATFNHLISIERLSLVR
jgi:hypothetical protein